MNPRDVTLSRFRLDGRVALVTGASRGIGLATARAFAGAGARVILSSNEPENCYAEAQALRDQGCEATGIGCDVTEPAELDNLVSKSCEVFGPVDILVCNAGAAPHFGSLESASEADIDFTLAVNLRHSIWLTNRVASGMADRGDGAIILMSSIAALRGADKIGVYAMVKSAIAQLARNLALEWGPRNVRVNSIAPGLIRTNFASGILDNPAVLEKRLASTPLRRLGEPEDIAAAALFLASPAGSFVTAQNIVVDGGLTMYNGG